MQGKEQLRTPSHPSGPVEPAFVAAEARNFALSLVESVTTTKIPLNDLHNTDVESLSSVEIADNLAPSGSAAVPEDIYEVPYCMPRAEISNFHLALGLWCDKESITRRAYERLSETLRLVNKVDEVHNLPCTLRTLQRWYQSRLPLPPLLKTIVPVKRAKQPLGLPNSSKSNMYFFNMRVLLATVLSTTKGHVFHTGMAHIVDSPSEYWHSRS